MARPSSRPRILDSFETLLVEGHGADVTLDAVAAQAGVSKGGLLYHFASKEALVEGLVARLRERVQGDVTALLAAPEGAIAYWLDTSSVDTEEKIHRTYLATLRLAGAGVPGARAELREFDRCWTAALEQRIGDPVAARLVRLVGDGLYLESLTGVADGGDHAALVDLLERLVARSDPDRMPDRLGLQEGGHPGQAGVG